MSSSFSILLVLKDRAKYTKRFLSYLNYIRFPYPIIIADGGSDKDIQDTLSNHRNFSNLHYEYRHYGFDETLQEFHHKMASAVDLVKTPLVSVMDNDDFMLLEGIRRSVEFLKENRDYSSTRGMIQLASVSENVSGHLTVGHNMYRKHPNSIDALTASERTIMQTKHFHGNWHNITRSNHVKACWKMLGVSKPTNMRFTEQVTGYINIMFGKGGRFNYPWILHQQADRIRTKDGILCDHFPSQEEWIRSSHWVENFIKMSEIVAVSISEKDGMPIEEAIELFYRSYSLKLPHLKNILDKEVAKCREVGYNKERVEKLRSTIRECNIHDILEIEDTPQRMFSPDEELNILGDFLANFRV